MKRWIVLAGLVLSIAAAAAGQRATFTGTVVIYGSGANTRTTSDTFNLTLDRVTSPAEADRLLSALQSGGQDDLRDALRHNEVGRFSIGGHVGLPVEAA